MAHTLDWTALSLSIDVHETLTSHSMQLYCIHISKLFALCYTLKLNL